MIKSFKINTKAPLHDKALKSCSTSLPGGDQVDGLPPAASTKYSCLEIPGRTELFIIFHDFFKFLAPVCSPSLYCFPKLQAIEKQILLHTDPQYHA